MELIVGCWVLIYLSFYTQTHTHTHTVETHIHLSSGLHVAGMCVAIHQHYATFWLPCFPGPCCFVPYVPAEEGSRVVKDKEVLDGGL